VDLHGLQGDSLPHRGLQRELQGKTLLVQRLKHLLPPPSSLTLVSAELFLSHHLTPLSSLPFHRRFFFPLLNYVITEVLPPLLIGLALASSGSILEPAGIGSIRHRGSFSQLLTEATPIAPRYRTLATQSHNTKDQQRNILSKTTARQYLLQQ